MPQADLVVVANRLPVDRVPGPDGEQTWRRSPGGLVTALEPVMRRADGAWVGWPGQPDLEVEPFEFEGTHLVPVSLSADDVELYYEGFSNDTIWPLYHDVIAEPRYSRAVVGRVRAGQPALRRGRGIRPRRGRHRLGAGLPAAARAADAPRAPARLDHRLLPPHSLPGIRSLLAAAVAPAGARGTARRRRHRLPAGGGCRQLRPRRAPSAALRDEGVGHHRAARGRHAPGSPARGRSRSRSTPPRTSSSPGDPTCARAPPRSARASATRRRSCSASTGSTTRRASATG